jgi:ABC-type nitrate/sulfonate/bicarbonate transport system permease component
VTAVATIRATSNRGATVRSWVPGVVGILGTLVIWQIIGSTSIGEDRRIPAPTAIISQLMDDGWSFYSTNVITTTREAAWGWFYGNTIAIGLAVLFVLIPIVEKPVMRMAIAAYCLPIIAIGPILQILYSGDTPKIILAALTCFFTTLIGATLGFRSADRTSIDLVRAYGGGEWKVMRKVRLKSSLPALFAGLRVAAPAAVLGAIIAEYLGGDSGLGVSMVASQQSLNVERTWGIALVSTALAGIGYGVTALVGRLLTPWIPRSTR